MFCCYILFSNINWVILVFVISVHVTFNNATTYSSLSKHSCNYHLIRTRVVFSIVCLSRQHSTSGSSYCVTVHYVLPFDDVTLRYVSHLSPCFGRDRMFSFTQHLALATEKLFIFTLGVLMSRHTKSFIFICGTARLVHLEVVQGTSALSLH